MKFKKIIESYLLKESPTYSGRRSKSISKEDFVDIFKSNCSEFSPRNAQIYRGVKGFDSKYGMVDPTSGNRRSAGAVFYHELMKHLPKWSQFPKRHKSLICTNNKKVAFSNAFTRDHVYRVIPFNGARFGVCPKSDIWVSFDKVQKHATSIINSIFGINNIIEFLANGYNDNNLNYNPESFQNIKSTMSKLTLDDLNREHFKSRCSLESGLSASNAQMLFDIYDDTNSKNIWEMFLAITDPSDFKIMSQSQIPKSSSRDDSNEVWTDSKCLLIHHSLKLPF